MKISEHLLKFPKYLPNDLEGFIFTYPNKFPKIVPYYEEVVKKVAYDPNAYKEYADWAAEEMRAAYEKIKKDLEEGDQDDLKFLVETDQRLNKAFCFRFWVVNYLFADGPIHEFYVDTLRNKIRKFVDSTEDYEDFEDKVVKIQRDLLQSDYADLYLKQALKGVKLVELLNEIEVLKPLMAKIVPLIDKRSTENFDEINKLWREALDLLDKDDSSDSDKLKEMMYEPLEQAKMRNTMVPVYNMMTHSVEFREENKNLEKRQEEMIERIESLKREARGKLSSEDYELFVLSYEQAKNCAMYKDIIGNIDVVLLPLWFGIHTKIKQILDKERGTNLVARPTGHASMFYFLVWHLPDELKSIVMTPDATDYSLETL